MSATAFVSPRPERLPQGEQATWVLLHGVPLGPSIWDGVAAALGRYGSVLQPHLIPAVGVDVMEGLSRQLVEDLSQIRGALHLVGHSFGGQVAIDAALLFGARVASLTLICTRDTPFPGFRAVAEAVREGRAPSAEATLARWFRPQELQTDADVLRQVRRHLVDADHYLWATCLEAIATFDRSQCAAELRMPVRLVAAAYDQVSTVGVMSDMAARLPQPSITVLNAAAHMSPFLDPAGLSRLILASYTN